MILGIDATNIRSGGGLTHLIEILENATPAQYGIKKVIVWSNIKTLSQLPEKKWLEKKTHPWLNRFFVFSYLFQTMLLVKMLKSLSVDVLFVPGGTYLGNFKNVVSMSQNMLPFEKVERNRFPSFRSKLRFIILEKTQSETFKKSKGVIFLTEYAKNYITKRINLKNSNKIISHGISFNFLQKPKPQQSLDYYSDENPFRFLYVSIVTVYKHQWNVAEAVLKLRREGYPVSLQLVGGSTPESLEKLQQIMKNDRFNCIDYKGLVPYQQMAQVYKKADGFIFASSCENQPIILIEAMTSGLPVMCSKMGPMPEVLGEAGFYFNPLETDSIYTTLKDFLSDRDKREKKSEMSYGFSVNYTWKDCADKTFEFLSRFK